MRPGVSFAAEPVGELRGEARRHPMPADAQFVGPALTGQEVSAEQAVQPGEVDREIAVRRGDGVVPVMESRRREEVLEGAQPSSSGTRMSTGAWSYGVRRK